MLVFLFKKKKKPAEQLETVAHSLAVRLPQPLIVSYQLPHRHHSLVKCILCAALQVRFCCQHPKYRSHTAAQRLFACLAVTSHYSPTPQHLQLQVRDKAFPWFRPASHHSRPDVLTMEPSNLGWWSDVLLMPRRQFKTKHIVLCSMMDLLKLFYFDGNLSPVKM